MIMKTGGPTARQVAKAGGKARKLENATA